MLCSSISLLGLLVLPSLGMEIVYESATQLGGFDVLQSTLRARKFNRTTMVLNGTLSFKVPLDDTFMIHTDFYHSPLGNQQFSLYPMKLPTNGACKFVKDIHDSYADVIKDVINYPKRGECPISPRDLHVINEAFPPDVGPPIFPKGLWKIIITTKVNNVEKIKYELILKTYKDKFF